MDKYCKDCTFFSKYKKEDTSGTCSIMGAMVVKRVFILDKVTVLEKIRKPNQLIHNPIIVQNMFGCPYQKVRSQYL